MPAAVSTLDDPAETAPNRVTADPEVRRLRSTYAANARHGNRAAADEARRALDVHRLAEHIRKVVDSAPPLTDAQRERLTLLLAPAPGAVAHGT